jgi:hypothetical protein
MSRAAVSGRTFGRLFDIVRWDYRERFGDAPQFAARSSVLILRSARALELLQIRASGRASRRMKRGPASSGCACSLFSSCLLLLLRAIRADPRGAGRAHFLLSSWSLRESTGARLCPASCFSPVVYRKKQGHRMGRAADAILDCRQPSRHARGRARR